MDSKSADEFLLAFTAAYVWVACADEGLDGAEVVKFEHVLIESPFATQFNVDHIRRYFKDTVEMFRTDFDKSIEVTKERLKKISARLPMAQEILRACRAAVIADGHLGDAEENALSEIAKTLGIAGAP
ncbi:MAG: TerB family tellurite resistance protein [Bdellovibrionales bacterium]